MQDKNAEKGASSRLDGAALGGRKVENLGSCRACKYRMKIVHLLEFILEWQRLLIALAVLLTMLKPIRKPRWLQLSVRSPQVDNLWL